MLYEKDFFEYRFRSAGEFNLKALNLPNVSLKIHVKETERLSQHDLSASNIELSFLSSQSISQFLEKSNFLMRHDHKMNRLRQTTNYMFSKGESNGPEEICNYFGVKSSLMEKYEILNRMFGVSGTGTGAGKGEQMGRVFGQIRISQELGLHLGNEVANIQSLEREADREKEWRNGDSGVQKGSKGKMSPFTDLEIERNSDKENLRTDTQDFKEFKREFRFGNWGCSRKKSNEAKFDSEKTDTADKLKNPFPEAGKGSELVDSERYLEFFRGRFE